jgi:hypothetical protein
MKLTQGAIQEQLCRGLVITIDQTWVPSPEVIEDLPDLDGPDCQHCVSVRISQFQPGRQVCLSLEGDVEWPQDEGDSAYDLAISKEVRRLGDALLSRLIPLAELERGYNSPLC